MVLAELPLLAVLPMLAVLRMFHVLPGLPVLPVVNCSQEIDMDLSRVGVCVSVWGMGMHHSVCA